MGHTYDNFFISKFIKKKVVSVLLIVLFSCDGGIRERCGVEYEKLWVNFYVGPRKIHYGFGDNGIYRYKFKSESKFISNEANHYYTDPINKDSIIEYFFHSEPKEIGFKKRVLKSLIPTGIVKRCRMPKAAIVFNQIDHSDTIFVDEELRIFHKNEIQDIRDSVLFKELFSIMPEELRSNWKENIMVW